MGLGLRTVPYYGYSCKMYGYITGKFSYNRTVYFSFGLLNGTLRVKIRIYGHIYGHYYLGYIAKCASSSRQEKMMVEYYFFSRARINFRFTNIRILIVSGLRLARRREIVSRPPEKIRSTATADPEKN